ncbi:hypothetical protein QWZ08_26355 [Ferruginibacter paludis]|uniref:hypothetical protein n=1 Tax=Ferruginibacter paludis TaxID=1310417 RepID=UPI0025B36D77|nr:hypothetical protein [Ferruginibacter paludis]MDN3659195.1 hypothetical protein [Ferruginibacter paludis]
MPGIDVIGSICDCTIAFDKIKSQVSMHREQLYTRFWVLEEEVIWFINFKCCRS